MCELTRGGCGSENYFSPRIFFQLTRGVRSKNIRPIHGGRGGATVELNQIKMSKGKAHPDVSKTTVFLKLYQLKNRVFATFFFRSMTS